jgi:hypothetical protein
MYPGVHLTPTLNPVKPLFQPAAIGIVTCVRSHSRNTTARSRPAGCTLKVSCSTLPDLRSLGTDALPTSPSLTSAV